jgi:hypothetical protein
MFFEALLCEVNATRPFILFAFFSEDFFQAVVNQADDLLHSQNKWQRK